MSTGKLLQTMIILPALSRESDDERYQFLAAEFDRASKELKNAELQLESLKSSVVPKASE